MRMLASGFVCPAAACHPTGAGGLAAANARRIAGLVLHGKWLSRADLDKLLAHVASAAAQG